MVREKKTYKRHKAAQSGWKGDRDLGSQSGLMLQLSLGKEGKAEWCGWVCRVAHSGSCIRVEEESPESVCLHSGKETSFSGIPGFSDPWTLTDLCSLSPVEHNWASGETCVLFTCCRCAGRTSKRQSSKCFKKGDPVMLN